jgi:hypothetical protein
MTFVDKAQNRNISLRLWDIQGLLEFSLLWGIVKDTWHHRNLLVWVVCDEISLFSWYLFIYFSVYRIGWAVFIFMRHRSLVDLLYYILHFLCWKSILLLDITWVVRLLEVLIFNCMRYKIIRHPVNCRRWWSWWRLCTIDMFNSFECLLPVILTLST